MEAARTGIFRTAWPSKNTVFGNPDLTDMSACGKRIRQMETDLAQKLVHGLREAGIDFVTYLPETRLSQILPLLQDDEAFTLVPVSSEAEGLTIAAGASLGGKQAALYTEGTGVYVSCYNLLTVGKRFGVPLLLLVANAGSFEDKRNSFIYALPGTTMIPFLEAFGIQYQVIQDGENLETKIKDAVRMMHSLKLPVALLFTGEFTV
jgi:sulfopyruvate decarboxylase TPP-binding subunit